MAKPQETITFQGGPLNGQRGNQITDKPGSVLCLSVITGPFEPTDPTTHNTVLRCYYKQSNSYPDVFHFVGYHK